MEDIAKRMFISELNLCRRNFWNSSEECDRYYWKARREGVAMALYFLGYMPKADTEGMVSDITKMATR